MCYCCKDPAVSETRRCTSPLAAQLFFFGLPDKNCSCYCALDAFLAATPPTKLPNLYVSPASACLPAGEAQNGKGSRMKNFLLFSSILFYFSGSLSRPPFCRWGLFLFAWRIVLHADTRCDIVLVFSSFLLTTKVTESECM